MNLSAITFRWSPLAISIKIFPISYSKAITILRLKFCLIIRTWLLTIISCLLTLRYMDSHLKAHLVKFFNKTLIIIDTLQRP